MIVVHVIAYSTHPLESGDPNGELLDRVFWGPDQATIRQEVIDLIADKHPTIPANTVGVAITELTVVKTPT